MVYIGKVTDFEQHIYNTHLRVQRTNKNQPYKNRKDFSDLDPRVQLQLKKISNLLAKYPHINLNEFISAPYKIYTDEKYFDLDFYISLKAIKAYTVYQQKKLFLEPDSDEQLEYIKNSLQFILSFCRDNNIEIDDYITHKTNDTFSFLLHLKEHRVNVYCLLGVTNFDKIIKTVDYDLLSFIIGSELANNIPLFKVKFLNSKKARTFVELGIQKLKNIKTQKKLD